MKKIGCLLATPPTKALFVSGDTMRQILVKIKYGTHLDDHGILTIFQLINPFMDIFLIWLTNLKVTGSGHMKEIITFCGVHIQIIFLISVQVNHPTLIGA